MSRIWSSSAMDRATPVSGWGAFGSVGQGAGGFRSLYGEAQAARPWTAAHPGHADPAPMPFEEQAAPDPVEEAAREAFVQGFREGERVTREAMERDNDVRAELAAGLQAMAQAGEGTLASLLSEAVIRLVTQVIGDVPIDAETLGARCAAVAACIDEDGARAVIEVSPEDLPLLEAEQAGVALAANAELPRGSVRLATAEGWVEDGPDVRIARLRALMDDMEGRL